MRPEYRTRWLNDIGRYGDGLKRPYDLLMRKASTEDFLDSAVIGGMSLADILSGKVAEWQIPHDVLNAYHLQYPGLPTNFVDEIQHLSGDPEKLMGIINGIKGKLFEIDYTSWLNSGHLPQGYVAELAHNANNPAWDISIKDGHGNIHELLQLKATASVSYIRSAIEAHPHIDVVVPHNMYQQLSEHSSLLPHVIDSHVHLGHVTDHVSSAVDQADALGIHYHVPVLAFAFTIGQNVLRYRRGAVTLKEALQNASERAMLAAAASAASWVSSLVAGHSFVGIPVAVGTRLVGGQLLHNRDRRKTIDAHIVIIKSSRSALRTRFSRVVH